MIVTGCLIERITRTRRYMLGQKCLVDHYGMEWEARAVNVPLKVWTRSQARTRSRPRRTRRALNSVLEEKGERSPMSVSTSMGIAAALPESISFCFARLSCSKSIRASFYRQLRFGPALTALDGLPVVHFSRVPFRSVVRRLPI